MQGNRVVIVPLRRPNCGDREEKRSDPFWEFGSFGITKCHDKNLMNCRNAHKLDGVRLAFAQGGHLGTRLVHLTSPVEIVVHRDRIEALWSPKEMPFRYGSAPVLIRNAEHSDFPRFESSIEFGRRTTAEGQFASNFRSRASYIDESLADELIEIYTRKRRAAPDSAIASSYTDALPWLPPMVDGNREETYMRLLNEARQPESGDGCCGRRRTRSRCSLARLKSPLRHGTP